MTAPSINHGPARRHLGRRDPILKDLMRRVGPCTLTIDADHFSILTRSIISQQISTKAARSIHARLLQALPKGKLKPINLLGLSDERMRAAGLSANKVRSLRDLAEKVHTKVVPLTRLHRMDDEDVIEHLVTVRGIGRWTAEMFLIFSLGRLDVLPVDDLGLRAGVRDVYALPELPDKASLIERGEDWRPYRSIATWYFWRSRGAVPQSKT
jgi:DNA-3-methyladenine glycosylase II